MLVVRMEFDPHGETAIFSLTIVNRCGQLHSDTNRTRASDGIDVNAKMNIFDDGCTTLGPETTFQCQPLTRRKWKGVAQRAPELGQLMQAKPCGGGPRELARVDACKQFTSAIGVGLQVQTKLIGHGPGHLTPKLSRIVQRGGPTGKLHLRRVGLPWMESVVRAKRTLRMPVVVSRAETLAVLRTLAGREALMAGLHYGGRLRLMECLRLRSARQGRGLDSQRNHGARTHGRKASQDCIAGALADARRRRHSATSAKTSSSEYAPHKWVSEIRGARSLFCVLRK